MFSVNGKYTIFRLYYGPHIIFDITLENLKVINF